MPVYSLTDLNQHIRQTLEDEYPEAIWVRAEIASLTLNSFSGHCYLDLTDGQGQAAKAKAMIWKKTFEILHSKFRIQTGSNLEKGMNVQLLVKVEFNIQYGLSLVVWDIDASYTVGSLAIQKTEIINRLKQEGRFSKNKEALFPFPSQRIAIISSPTAAGFEDFKTHLMENEFGFAFQTTLFPAQMQGKEAIPSIQKAFQEIENQKESFDVIAFIRGGGSSLDLQVFDEYEVAHSITQSSLAVLTGIGHEKDESVCDLVAYQAFKTPTAVAGFFIDQLAEADYAVTELSKTITQSLVWSIRKEEQVFESMNYQIQNSAQKAIQKHQRSLDQVAQGLQLKFQHTLFVFNKDLDLWESRIQFSNPVAILKAGYARVFQSGQRIKARKELQPDGPVLLQFQDGTLVTKPLN